MMKKEFSEWCSLLGINNLSDLNRINSRGDIKKIINLSEAYQERKFAILAQLIALSKGRFKVVFLAGPSSSGKTSSSLKLAMECKVSGLNPKVIELDNYFVDRDRTPKDENGNYDYECLEAMDLELLNKNINDLLDGKTVEIPRYDFKTGTVCFEGNMMTLEENDILIMEGIHALDPKMVEGVPQSRIFRIYASALTALKLDDGTSISTTDNRMLRRIVRDNRTRGINPEQTILRWASVRNGEEKYIFPFQDNADAYLNSAQIYEIPLLKLYAEPLLKGIPEDSPAYPTAKRLIEFLDKVVPLSPEAIACIPSTSTMREFVGGQYL